jgi:hypothetical protein
MARQTDGPPDLQALRRDLAMLRSKLAEVGVTSESEEAAFAAMRRDLEALQADLQWKAENAWSKVRPEAGEGLAELT